MFDDQDGLGVSWWMFLPVLAYPSNPRQRAVEQLCVCLVSIYRNYGQEQCGSFSVHRSQCSVRWVILYYGISRNYGQEQCGSFSVHRSQCSVSWVILYYGIISVVCVGLFVSTESLLATTLCFIQNIPDVFRHNSNICRWILTISRRNVSPESRQLKGGIIFNLAW